MLLLIRSIATLVWALGVAQPTLAPSLATTYAKAIHAEQRARGIDGLTFISIIKKESGVRQAYVSPDGHDIGLGQIRAMYIGGCLKMRKRFAKPNGSADHAAWRKAVLKNPTAACLATKQRLKNGPYNIRRMGAEITAWRKLCRSKKRGTGRPALLSRWLAGYGGLHRPHHRCGQKKVRGRWRDTKMHPAVARIIRYRRNLIRKLNRRYKANRRRARR